jgi:predicted kinase
MKTEKSKCYILVGVPGAGKTTWVQNQNFDTQLTAIIGTDRYVERYARRINAPYSDVFEGVMPQAIKSMINTLRRAVKLNLDIVWDQTSTTIPSRLKKLRMIPPNYEKIAVVCPTPDLEELNRRLDSRPGKHVPQEVVHQMISEFAEPTLEEGFDKIIHAS